MKKRESTKMVDDKEETRKVEQKEGFGVWSLSYLSVNLFHFPPLRHPLWAISLVRALRLSTGWLD